MGHSVPHYRPSPYLVKGSSPDVDCVPEGGAEAKEIEPPEGLRVHPLSVTRRAAVVNRSCTHKE